MFIFSEKATKFFEISTVDFSYVVKVKSTVEISQNFVAFSEYMNTRKNVEKSKNFNLSAFQVFFKTKKTFKFGVFSSLKLIIF